MSEDKTQRTLGCATRQEHDQTLEPGRRRGKRGTRPWKERKAMMNSPTPSNQHPYAFDRRNWRTPVRGLLQHRSRNEGSAENKKRRKTKGNATVTWSKRRPSHRLCSLVRGREIISMSTVHETFHRATNKKKKQKESDKKEKKKGRRREEALG